LNSINLDLQGFSWSTNINFTLPKNELLDFPDLASSSYASDLVIGQSILIRKVYHFIGVDPVSGIYLFADGKGGNTTRPDTAQTLTRNVIINTLPTFYGGFQNTFRYKSFEVDGLFQFVKQKGPNYQFGSFPGGSSTNQPAWMLDRWQKTGDVRDFQQYRSSYPSNIRNPQRSATNSDGAYSDASFIRLKNLSLSWTMPASWQRKVHLRDSRIYIQGQNLLTITKYKGLDPETLISTTLPPLKVIAVGLNIGL
jgi:hypothetical protein